MRRYVLIALLFSGSPAFAALLSVDVFAPGDGLATRDTETGFEWLDSSVLSGASGTVEDYLDGNVAQATQLNGLGFDIAGSMAEYTTFLNHAGIEVGELHVGPYTVANLAGLTDLYELGWLPNLPLPLPFPSGCYPGFYPPAFRDMSNADSSDPYNPNGITGFLMHCLPDDGTAAVQLGIFADSVPDLYQINQFAFVRHAAVVPLPGALPAFVSGIASLLVLLRRRGPPKATLS